jgi:murein DD-endopeptidase MepM/ murein hydrolase activator NlpD
MVLPVLCFITLFLNSAEGFNYYLPVNTGDRKSVHTLQLTNIGEYGLHRKERPAVPAHYHTGIDIKRPRENYHDEPIYTISEGRVISIRKDGPYAQIIIEHGSIQKFWTVYEHIAGIKVGLNERVKPDSPIARFMNKNELNKYGWQFDHFHFEVLKVEPFRLKHDHSNPDRKFSSYSLLCYTKDELNKYFYNPAVFLKHHFQ